MLKARPYMPSVQGTLGFHAIRGPKRRGALACRAPGVQRVLERL